MITLAELENQLKRFILDEFLPGEDEDDLTLDLALVSTGILDSISVMKVVAFIEESYSIQFDAADASVDNMNTITAMAKLIARKTESV